MKLVGDSLELEEARRALAVLLDACASWFVEEQPSTGRRETGRVELRRGEWDLSVSARGLLFSYWGAAGLRSWRVAAWERRGDKLRLQASRRMGAERATLELIARAPVSAARACVLAARRAACERLAALASAAWSGSKPERVHLSAGARRGEPGAYARIILKRGGERIAVTGPVVERAGRNADALLASALLWFARRGEASRRRSRGDCPRALWLVVPRPLVATLGERLALLRADWRRAIELYEIGEEGGPLVRCCVPQVSELLRRRPRHLLRSFPASGELVERILALAPGSIDAVHARKGVTLRFRGLPFARVRPLPGGEQAWFGITGARARGLLTSANWPELSRLVDELAAHRCAEARDRRHALYTPAPEAWLESILRRDITCLDPGLILSPLHAQLRTTHAGAKAARPLDLLALRRDGRLVVIELKVTEDAALAFQGADYWRRVEAHRLHGHIRRARLFDDKRITDAPPLVYLVAPMLSFHRSFDMLARTIDPRLELYRFDLNEDWRAGVRVMRRALVA